MIYSRLNHQSYLIYFEIRIDAAPNILNSNEADLISRAGVNNDELPVALFHPLLQSTVSSSI